MPGRGARYTVDVAVIGVGPGGPRQITLEAVDALGRLDAVVLLDKGESTASMRRLRTEMLERYAPDCDVLVVADPPRDRHPSDYATEVRRWHAARVDAIAEAIAALPEQPGRDRVVGFLVWGDPSLYDSTLRIAERLARHMSLRLKVIPGITAIQTLCAAHAIPLNDLAAPVTITTGRRLRDTGWPEGADTAVVMLDSGGAFTTLDPAGVHIWWGAYVGMENQILLSGPLAEMADLITETRAKARADHGWIMDIYLMRRSIR